MDKLKTRVLFISLIILALVSISAVAAADSEEIISANQEDFDLSEETINDVEQTSADAQDESDVSNEALQAGSNTPLTADGPGSFTELQEKIDAAEDGATIVLDYDYVMADGENPIIINKTIIIDGQGYKLDASHRNATMSCLEKVTLKNIIFTNAYCTGYCIQTIFGYNIYFYGALNLNDENDHYGGCDGSIIDNCTFENNEAYNGAGIHIFSDDCVVKNSRFVDNVAYEEGRGLFAGGAIVVSGDNCKIQDSNFTGNKAVNSSGAIFWEGSHGEIDGCNFTSNEAGNGGAVEYYLCNDQKIINSYFSKNKATKSEGGALHTATDTLDDIKIENCVFEENDAKTIGGAIYLISNGPINITNSKFYNNTATSEGGAIYVDTSNLYFENDEFINNSAELGGAFSIDQTHASYNPSQQIDNDNITVINSIFIENTAGNGGAVYTESPDYLTFDNCQFVKNDATGIYDPYYDQTFGYGGAIYAVSYMSKINVTNSVFIENSANGDVNYGGAIQCSGKDSIINSSSFENNTAQRGGAVSLDGPNIIVDNSTFTGNNATYGGGAWVSGNADSIKNSTFERNNATQRAGAVYVAGLNDIFNTVEFRYNSAPAGGAIYVQSDNLRVNNAIFEENNATDAGAIYAGGAKGNSYNLGINDTQFINNNATRYGGALLINIGGVSEIENAIFKENKAFNGSAIYHNIGSLVISDTELLENLANSTSLTLEIADIKNNFDVFFRTEFIGQDNLLNAINSNNDDVTLTNVKYHGFEEEMTTDSNVKPVASADDSNEGALVYKDAREAGINITVCVFDENDNFLFNITDMTDIYGNNSAKKLALPAGKYKAYAVHEEDAYYTYIKSETVEFEIEYVDVFVTVDRVVNYTGAVVDVIANVTDAKGNNITGGTATFTIHYDNKISSSGLLMASSESYTAEVIDGKAVFKGITLGAPGLYPSTIEYSGNEYYNSAENESEVEVLPLNTTTSSHDVSGTAGDKVTITADIVDQNGNPVKNGTAVLTVNGKKYTAEVKDGKAVFKDVELPSKSTPATIDYLGNDYYNPSSTTIQITVTQPENNETEDEPSTPVSEKTVPVIPAAGNPIALAVMALLTLVSTVSLGRKK